MIVPLSNIDESLDSDIIIVGAGAVGLVMAVNLARCGYRVRLFEAGAATLTERSQQVFEQAQSLGHRLPGLHVGRFRMLGGTTNFWGGQLLHLDPSIFEGRQWLDANSGWPISAADIDPFYTEVLNLLGMGHAICEDSEVYRRYAIIPPDIGKSLDLFLTRWTPEPNLIRHFEKELRTAANINIHIEAPVSRFVCDDEGDAIRGVLCQDAAGRTHSCTAKVVVLAAGTLEIVRLLGAPLADGNKAPWAQLSALGRGFMDHLDCEAGVTRLLDKRRFHDLFDGFHIAGIKYQPKLRLSNEIRSSRRLLDVSGRFAYACSFAQHINTLKSCVKSIPRGYWQRNAATPQSALASAADGTGSLLAAPAMLAKMMLRYLRYRRIYNPADLGVRLRLTAEQRQLYDSRIVLRQERDQTGLPIADVDWRIDGMEIESMAVFAEAVRDLLKEQGLAVLEIDSRLVSRDRNFLTSIEDSNHHMGAVRMSTSPDRGVVDKNLRVYGSRNLFVAGAAVFPSSGAANPTFAAMALGLRLCRYLKNSNLLSRIPERA